SGPCRQGFVYAGRGPHRPVHPADASLAGMALSDQLTDLAGRTKRLEDTAKAAETQNRQKPRKERDQPPPKMQKEAKDLQKSAGTKKAEAQSWWADMTANVEQQRAKLHADIEKRKAERKLDNANRNADDAEQYAEGMISLAAYVIDAAE